MTFRISALRRLTDAVREISAAGAPDPVSWYQEVTPVNIIRQLNAAMEYIEENLQEDVDAWAAARIACVAPDSFLRFFSYMTGMSLAEYVRRRRLTLAAEDIRGGVRVVDAAVKYGYDSAAAFSRAFARQHGMNPSEFRRRGGALRICPPASFRISILGAKDMDMRIVEFPGMTVMGIARPYAGGSREQLRHEMWAAECLDVPGMLCGGAWNQPGSTAYDGEWYGIWRDGAYMIAREPGIVKDGESERRVIPAGTYAVFRTGKGVRAWEEFPRLFEEIFEAWLPTSGYRQAGELIVERLHLFTEHEVRRRERFYEAMIPIEAVKA